MATSRRRSWLPLPSSPADSCPTIGTNQPTSVRSTQAELLGPTVMKGASDSVGSGFRRDDQLPHLSHQLAATCMSSSLFRFGGIFISCVNLWRHFHLMGSPILTLWGHCQAKSLFLLHWHSHVMCKPTIKEVRRKKFVAAKRKRIIKRKKKMWHFV